MQTIAFYNLKGGVGKTASAVNVAWHAARWKHRTLLWDLDPQGAASFYLGVDDGDGYKAGNLIKGKQPIGRLKRETRWKNLDAIPADISMRNADIKLMENGGAKSRLKQLIAPLGESYELVILDCPPTLSPMAESIFAAV
ncbi:MAG: ParA family protein, partial [Alcanivorax sp.]